MFCLPKTAWPPTYEGKTYVGQNVEHPLNKCKDCHDVHALEPKLEACAGCHGEVGS